MKILHEPYGIDDPYKTAPCERYPRDPRPGDEVQVRFKVEPGAEFAWADVITGGDCRRVEAKPLGDGFWTVDLGRFQPGLVSYELGARAGAQAADPAPSAGGPRFHFEVGAWHRVVAVHDVVELPDRVRLRLATTHPRRRLPTPTSRSRCPAQLVSSCSSTGRPTLPNLPRPLPIESNVAPGRFRSRRRASS